MAIEEKNNENDNSQASEDLTVSTIEFPFNMPSPDFGGNESIDGTVLHLNDILASEDHMVVFKALDDGLIHLIAGQTVVETGVVNQLTDSSVPEFLGFHYYVFEDELTVYSEQALVLL